MLLGDNQLPSWLNTLEEQSWGLSSHGPFAEHIVTTVTVSHGNCNYSDMSHKALYSQCTSAKTPNPFHNNCQDLRTLPQETTRDTMTRTEVI